MSLTMPKSSVKIAVCFSSVNKKLSHTETAWESFILHELLHNDLMEYFFTLLQDRIAFLEIGFGDGEGRVGDLHVI